jgi:hypothetical protein
MDSPAGVEQCSARLIIKIILLVKWPEGQNFMFSILIGSERERRREQPLYRRPIDFWEIGSVHKLTSGKSVM